MAGLDRYTGRPLAGFDEVVQSIHVILTTRIGERVMRRHFGSNVSALLGRLLTPGTVLKFFVLIAVAIYVWEPRFRITKVTPVSLGLGQTRLGHFGFVIEGEYRPRAHLGDQTPEGIKRISLGLSSSGLQIEN